MPISFSCATCGKPYVVDERFAGKKAACRMCGNVNWIPSAEYAGVRPNPLPEQQLPPQAPGARPGVIPDDFDPLPLSVVDRSDPTDGAKPAAADDDIPMAELDELEEADDDSGTLDLVDDEPPPPRVKAAAVTPLPVESIPPFPTAPPPARPAAAKPQFAKPLKALPVEGCPNCGEILGEKAIFCTACGYNLKTGKAASTTVHADDEDEDDGDDHGAGSTPPREPNPALRSAGLFLIAGGVGAALLGVMALPIPGLRVMTMVGPLIGALLCMIGGVIYFIDGAMPFAMAGGGGTVFALILLFSIGRKSDPPPPPPPVALAPATAPTSQPDPPKVERTGPDTFTVRKPKPGENVILYWRPVIQDADPGIRLVAIEQLKKVQDPWKGYAADEIATRATEEDPTVRKSAMANLSIAATPKTVAAAIKGLDDSDEEVARLALAALARFKSDEAVAPLASHYAKLGDPVLDALGGYPAKSKEKVAEAYRTILAATTDPAVRGRVMGLIVKTGPEAAGAILVQYVADADPQVRALAMGHLAELKYAPAVPPIVERLTADPGPAGKALAAYGPVAEKGLLEKLGGGGDAKLKVQVLGVLRETATVESLAAVQAAAKDADLGVAMAARQVWRKIDPAGLSPLDEALMDLAGARPFALRALDALRTMPMGERRGEVARRLYAMLGAGGGADADVQNQACEVLKTWADDGVRDLVIAGLRPDGEEARRPYAIRLAVHFKDPRAVRPLVDCLAQNRSTPEVMAALAEFGPASEESLIKLLSAGGDTGVQEKTCELLKEIGTRRCFRALTAIASVKGGDEKMKKLANQTMIEINRRLNTAAARGASGGGATTHPAGESPATTRSAATRSAPKLPRPTTTPTGPNLW